MACFLVPTAEAVVTTVAKKVIEKKENSSEQTENTVRFSEKIGWLNNMLWGGSALLAFEHVWHGEVVPFFPFLTNAVNPADAAGMLHEMATSGTAMAALVTAAWAGMVIVTNKLKERHTEPESPKTEAVKQ